MIRRESEYLLAECNFTEDEKVVFKDLVKGESNIKIAFDLNASLSTANRRIRSVKEKIDRVERG